MFYLSTHCRELVALGAPTRSNYVPDIRLCWMLPCASDNPFSDENLRHASQGCWLFRLVRRIMNWSESVHEGAVRPGCSNQALTPGM